MALYDISTATFNQIALDVSSEETSPYSMLFNNDGSKLYVMGYGKDINEYDLSTNYDISTGSFNQIALDVSSEELSPFSMMFNDDGSKLYVMGSVGDDINEYDLSTNYDISTATFNQIALDVSGEETIPRNMMFNDDGSKLYVLGSGGKDINEYDLSTNYDISTATFNKIALDVSSEEIYPFSMMFNDDGSKLYVMGYGGKDINEYDLSTNYDISTATFNQIALDVGSKESYPSSMMFNDDGSKLYVLGYSGDDINEYVMEGEETGTNTQINIGDSWKEISAMQINIGDTWKEVAGAQINIGDL